MRTIAHARRAAAGLMLGAALLAGVALLAQTRPPAPGSRRFPLPTEPRVYQTFVENDGAVIRIEPEP